MARRDLLVLIREIGQLQTGQSVDIGWIAEAARTLGKSALGVVGWQMGSENIPEALEAVVEAAKEQLKHDRRSTGGSDDDPPF